MVGHAASNTTWTGPAGPATSEYDAIDAELLALTNTLLTGEIVLDRAAAEHLVRVLGAVISLHATHRVDQDGDCTICRSPRRTWRYSPPAQGGCTVHAALSQHLGVAAPASGEP